MPEYTYPGVYTQEISKGPGPIAGVTSSNLGLLGFTEKGEVDKPILVTSYSEFVSKFGTFTSKGLTPTMAYAFFQNGGQRLYVVRATAADAEDAYWNFTYDIPTTSPDDLGNTVEASGIYNLQMDHPPVKAGTVVLTFNSATKDNVFTDAAGDGVLTKTSGSGSGGTGFIDYDTGEVTITLTDPADYAGGTDRLEAVYTYTVFQFRMKWPGDAGNYYRIVIAPGSDDYLVSGQAEYTHFTVSVEEDVDAGVTGVADWTVIEQFVDVVFDDTSSSSYVATVMNADFTGSDIFEVVEYGNEMNPAALAGSSITAEDFSATMEHSDGSSVVTPPDYYNGKWKGWKYALANGCFPKTFDVSFTFGEGGPVMATVTAAAGTAVVVGPDKFDTTLLPLAMDPDSPSVDIECDLTTAGKTHIIDTGVAGPGNLIEVSTGVVVGSIDHTTGVISNPAGTVLNTLDVSGTGLADTFKASSKVRWVNGTQIGTGGGAATASVTSFGDATTPAAITPSSVRISARTGDVATNTGITITLAVAGTTVTLTDTSNPFGSTKVGDIIVVQNATSAVNDGSFVVTSISAAPASVDFTNAAGVAQSSGDVATSWNTLGQLFDISDTGSTGAGNLVDGSSNAVGTIDYVTGQISDPAGTALNTLDLTAASTTFASGFAINMDADYAEPVSIVDDGDGNLSLDTTQATGYPQKFTLDANGTNEVTYDTGVFELTWSLAGNPSGGPVMASAQTADYYTDPADSVTGQAASGSDGSAMTSNDIIGSSLTADQRGLWAFGQVDALMQLVASDFQTDTTVADALITYAELVKDKFVILTVPAGLEPQEAVNWKKYQLNKYTSYAAIYYPHIKITDPVTEIPTDVPCGGHVAGVYARTDNNVNVGKAPAGVGDGSLAWSLGLERDLTNAHVGICSEAKINCLVSWEYTGLVVWGADLMDSAGSEWQYIQTRRLFQYVEKSVFQATHGHVFKNNGPGLWSAIRNQVTSFLTGLFDAGYFAGTSPSEAFFVVCDRSNNPQNTVDQGFVFCDVGLASNKPGKFIVFRYQQKSLV